MPLDIDQLRGLAELKCRQTALKDAIGEYQRAERQCWEMGISARQISVIAGEHFTTLYRRYSKRAAAMP